MSETKKTSVRMKHPGTATRSGLPWSTIRRYCNSSLLERHEEDFNPIYMHRADCAGFCDYACNGKRGLEIAEDCGELENVIE